MFSHIALPIQEIKKLKQACDEVIKLDINKEQKNLVCVFRRYLIDRIQNHIVGLSDELRLDSEFINDMFFTIDKIYILNPNISGVIKLLSFFKKHKIDKQYEF
ncbi:hypothetical protein [Campylobacter sp. RM12651]|uniref:hypothetical protein n=1 Tax=Campylobacter sp. RM12651 TaxID=1660079 RepID=UPI001EFA3272|nr:hypothetical protein [Campylobacter sp. RM12651]ULO03793.1 hypothetical protein AVBRAN_1339 [Campylobacter sp. RM12651]